MAKFSQQFIEQVAQATDIVDLVSQYVALKKRGKEFVGLCPFHDDKNPSMYVTPVKQIFKCFACGAGGGVFQFLMLYEKLTFPEAVRTLAERANLPLPSESARPQRAEGSYSKNDLTGVMTFAARFFRTQLNSSAGEAAMEYAKGRGLTDESIQRFGLGFAPDSWDSLAKAAGREGISEAMLLAAGLVAPRESGGCYDRFRNRLIFPIIDPQNRVIAFGGRALAEGERAKYLNSPESILFDKSSQLYALNWSREGIVSSGRAVVVEGYLDAIVPLQAGVNNVVATLGTALTDRHVRLLSRYAQEAVLIFDADVAGQAAAERALEVFLAQRLHVRVAALPEGKDPCDYCLEGGGEALIKLIDESPDALQAFWQKRQEAWQAAGSNLADRRRSVDEFLNLVVSSAAFGAIDEVRRGQLAQHIAHLINVPAADVQQQMRRLARRISRSSQQPVATRSPSIASGPTELAERQLLESLLNEPDLYDHAAERIDPSNFGTDLYRRLAECIWEAGNRGRLNVDELLATEELVGLGGLITDLLTAGQQRGNHSQTLDAALDHILYQLHRRDLQHLGSSPQDDDALRELTRRLKSPDVRRRPKVE